MNINNILFCIGATYFLTMIVLLCIGTAQGIIILTKKHETMTFRKSSILRLGQGMMCLFLLLCPWIASTATRSSEMVLIWCIYGPICVGLSCFSMFMAGPQDVCINLKTRVCYGVRGWLFYPRRWSCHLTESSALCACSGKQGYYVVLRVDASANNRFVLGATGSMGQAIKFAQEVTELLELPIVETTLKASYTLD